MDLAQACRGRHSRAAQRRKHGGQEGDDQGTGAVALHTAHGRAAITGQQLPVVAGLIALEGAVATLLSPQ